MKVNKHNTLQTTTVILDTDYLDLDLMTLRTKTRETYIMLAVVLITVLIVVLVVLTVIEVLIAVLIAIVVLSVVLITVLIVVLVVLTVIEVLIAVLIAIVVLSVVVSVVLSAVVIFILVLSAVASAVCVSLQSSPPPINLLGLAVAERLELSPPTKASRDQSPAGSPDFRMGNRAGLCRWPVGFLEDLPFPAPLHSDAAPYSLKSPSSDLNTSLLRAAPNLFTLITPPPGEYNFTIRRSRRDRRHPEVVRYNHPVQLYAEFGEDYGINENFSTPMLSEYQQPSPPRSAVCQSTPAVEVIRRGLPFQATKDWNCLLEHLNISFLRDVQ
ncbi:hypothetical protein PR048_029816 [Dryococelus australis]|uniref:Uncharacterized protein n=1 Tax=Dryococelus australis TaxID=614101 RepID=A0ABQ9G763_9NEOP|nr:hypothetical protein PR048_029816 [Dryococelus australis]